ncbi:MAG TPA: hypothetical protein VNM48_20735 [Chloroflexota bacterium]|nr:hypothetical protein [Chloroflexota bacterium]
MNQVPRTVRYRLRHVATGAFVRQGIVAGMLVALLPGLTLGVLTGSVIRGARSTLESWRSVRLPLPVGLSANVDVVELLRLGPQLTALRAWDGSGWLIPAAVALTVLLAGALLGAAVSLAIVLLLNLSARAGGGMVLDLEETNPTGAP